MKRVFLSCALAVCALAMAGCSSLSGGGTFENRLACSLDRSEGYVVSKWGLFGISTSLAGGDVRAACAAPAQPSSQGTPMKTTLSDYLSADLARGVIDHSLRANRLPGGGVSFLIYPANVDGQTADFQVDGNTVFNTFERAAAPSEAELQKRASVAPRVTPADIELAIASEHYYVPPGTTLTVCVLTLRNGFNVVGKSACASPENFKADIGQRFAFEDAKRQVWELEGYALRSALTANAVAA